MSFSHIAISICIFGRGSRLLLLLWRPRRARSRIFFILQRLGRSVQVNSVVSVSLLFLQHLSRGRDVDLIIIIMLHIFLNHLRRRVDVHLSLCPLGGVLLLLSSVYGLRGRVQVHPVLRLRRLHVCSSRRRLLALLLVLQRLRGPVQVHVLRVHLLAKVASTGRRTFFLETGDW